MPYQFSLAARQHLAYLPDIEEAALALFSYDDLPGPLRALRVLPGEFLRAMNNRLLWVATSNNDVPVGFLLACVIDRGFHIVEFDVHPAHGHRGVGTELLNHALAEAQNRSFVSATLTTFEHLQWNAPFYARRGFRVMMPEAFNPQLAEIVHMERQIGMKRRVAMTIPLAV
jgi:GNAT superfamily N-acetyltransferase